ncbi:MAG: GNAT family N-acetyltransferase [Lachnospiraceae bacterium]|nr:GNAT family N-acetyltransferase [Lachnospiraceae bacterium]
MLRKAALQDIAEYGDFAYRLALDQTKSCYPIYADGIKSKEDFIADAENGVTKENSELLLFLSDGIVEGFIKYEWLAEDNYLQLTMCNIREGTTQALTELLSLLNERFSGYTLYFGFPEANTDAVRFLSENGFTCLEESWNHSFFFDDYTLLSEDKNAVLINRENFDDFRTVYQPDAETYWNCDRILECLEDWTIFVYYQDGTPVGTIYLQGSGGYYAGYYEIFGISFADDKYRENACHALLTAALNHCKRNGAKYMTFLCEEIFQKILQKLGFHFVGKYICYIRTL